LGLIKLLSLLRSNSFDIKTEEGRRSERYRLAAIAIAANILSKSSAILLVLLSVSLTVDYLDLEQFSIWMLVLSFITMLSFLDLGIGNALTNHVAQRAVEDDKKILRDTISGGLGILGLIGISVGAVLLLISALMPWDLFFPRDKAGLALEVKGVAICFSVIFGLNLFTTGLQKIFLGLQKAYIVHLVSALGTILSCSALWIATYYQQHISMLLAAVFGTQTAISLALLLILVRENLFYTDGISQHVKKEIPFLYKNAGFFLVLQLGAIVGWGADNIIISGVLGITQVAIYVIAQRLFQFVAQPFSLINAPLWSAYADADARGDRLFIGRTLKRSLILTFLGTMLLALVLFFLNEWIIKIWTHGEIRVPFELIIACGVWTVLEATGNAFAMFLNGTGIVKKQMIVVCIFIILVLPLKIILTYYMGLPGIPVATIIIYIIVNAYFYGYLYYREIKNKVNLT
jgi:O-antigen/teichoic acid export membrane protein